jgi:hypothetical protein
MSVRVGVTRGPSEKWTAQQLRDATPFGQGPQFIIRDRDDKFAAEFDRVAKGAGTKVIRTAVKAPLMNSVCERYLGSVRREVLDHVIILGERHMKSVLEEYSFRYFNTMRPHQGLAQRIPAAAPRQTCSDASKAIAIPVLGGIHHDYRAAACGGRMSEGARTAPLVVRELNLVDDRRATPTHRCPVSGQPVHVAYSELQTRRARDSASLAPTNFVLPAQPLDVELPERMYPRRIDLSVDHNDQYLVQLVRSGDVVWTRLLFPPTADGLGTLSLRLPPPIATDGVDAIRVVPQGGDGLYGVGHLILVR